MNEKTKHYTLLFWSILAVAFLLRLYLALSTVYIWDEDRDWLALADTISYNNLPLHADYHSVLPAYFMKAGSMLLGRNPLGFRFFNLIAGVLTVALIFKFTLEWTSSLAASFWAASLLAFDEYHTGASVLASEKSLYLLFALLAIAAFIRFLRTERAVYLYLAAATIGLSFLCKELALLLFPIFFIILLLPKHRHWLRRRETYFAPLVFFVVISPDIYWNLTHHGPTHVNLADRLSQLELGFTPQPLMFYFHAAVLRIYRHFNRKLNPWLDYPHQNLVFGSMLFGGVLLAILRSRVKSHALILLALLFWSIFCFFLLMPSSHPVPKDLGSAAFYWIDITLLPAVVLTGHAFAGIAKRWRPAIYALFSAGAVYAITRVLIFHLGLPVLAVAYDPSFINPPDGRMVDVQAKFNSCMLCEREPKVELLDVKTIDDANNVSTSGVNTPDVAGATLGNDDRTFSLRATRDRRYEIIYRVTYSSGKVFFLDSNPSGTRAVYVLDDPKPLWRSPFWVH
jgi:4-amino-4-deoxy-L-arabinose transferase-like glycosyltransferase